MNATECWPIRLRLRLLIRGSHRWNAWVRDATAWAEGRWCRSSLCCCGQMHVYGGEVELNYVKHRLDGPCYYCDDYGRPL